MLFRSILTNKALDTFKITDFGISTQVKENMTTVKRTCAGTPWYMAPEVILDEPYSYGADIWSLGCLCFELFCGKRPYASFGGMQAMFQMVQHNSPIVVCEPETKKLFYNPNNIDILDFLQQCWMVKASERPKAAQLLEHPFLNQKEGIKTIPAVEIGRASCRERVSSPV